MSREVVAQKMWAFLWQQGGLPHLPTVEEIAAFIDDQVDQEKSASLAEAYTWLQVVLASDYHDHGEV